MAPTVTDALLSQTLTKIEASVPEKYQRGYDQIMAAGLKAMFSEKTFSMTKEYLQNVKSEADVPKIVSHGVIKLMSILFNVSQGKLQLEASGPAAVGLTVHALQYVEQRMQIPVSRETLAQTTHLVSQGLMVLLKQASKLSDEDFQKALTPKQSGDAQAGEPATVPAAEPATVPAAEPDAVPPDETAGVLQGA